MVGTAGFEPTTPTPPVWCATWLRYAPTFKKMLPECLSGATASMDRMLRGIGIIPENYLIATLAIRLFGIE
jgi:hypothetical protein